MRSRRTSTPFTLREVEEYPAHLHVDYPEHLSRGLVLVKWWLLALPHYLVVGILVGAGWQTARVTSSVGWRWEGGLIGLLALVAAVVLAVRGAYPRPLFDLLLGLHRWVLRVTAYAALMTDVYPPFRLDLGEHETSDRRTTDRGTTAATVTGNPPATTPVTVQPAAVQPALVQPEGTGPGATRAGPSGNKPSTTARLIGGMVLLVVGSGAFMGGASAAVAELGIRDGEYLTSRSWPVSTPGYAIELGDVEIHAPDAGLRFLEGVLGDVRVRATADDDGPLFLGVGTADDVAAYLDGVAHTRVVGERGRSVELPGGAPSMAPEETDIWIARSVGRGTQEVEITPRNGTWVAVVMPADVGTGQRAEVDVGATVPWLPGAAVTGLVLGLALIGAGAWLVGRDHVDRA
ncbi:DUF4389 domain-containing protein [Cellulomonas sp. ATA003]|uniref:DUF4389 domain-containing protein n=1 Tax=Cellulomonas sp. ATA003 TaxID=3073064 RepID=UPI0028738D7C|nr:DUF4389 domain-containing protein [Cellulomonas sp. ATA003]WNB86956.1 DUF4389 domain-containing protein [Cellulomonas sp. ATA003]